MLLRRHTRNPDDRAEGIVTSSITICGPSSLFLAERFGRLARRVGTRVLIIAGTLCSAARLYWLAAGAHPLAFWSRLIAGTTLFGLGISLTVSAPTHAAVAAVPETHAGAASGLNHAVAHAAGPISIALFGSLAAPEPSSAISAEGFGRAMMICAAVVAAGGVAGSVAPGRSARGADNAEV